MTATVMMTDRLAAILPGLGLAVEEMNAESRSFDLTKVHGHALASEST
jgi:hypothetical protein